MANRYPKDDKVAEIFGVGTTFEIFYDREHSDGTPLNRYAVTVSSGPATRILASDKEWRTAMDLVRDEISGELDAEERASAGL